MLDTMKNNAAALPGETTLDAKPRQGAFSVKKKKLLVLVGVAMGALCMFLALDFAVTGAMHPSSLTATTTRNNNQRVLRRRLDDIPIGEQVENAIQDAMDSGEIGSDNPAIVNVSWVPLGRLLQYEYLLCEMPSKKFR